MLRFSEFMSESMDSHYPYEHVEKKGELYPIHHYQFTAKTKDGKDNRVSVFIGHKFHKDAPADKYPHPAEISFHDSHDDSGEYAPNSNYHNGMKVLSTVKKIAQDHAEKHEISSYAFSGKSSEVSRIKAYDRLTKNAGGESRYRFKDAASKTYEIPVKK